MAETNEGGREEGGEGERIEHSACISPIINLFLPRLFHLPSHKSCPNPDDPLNNQVAELWKADEDRAIANAKEWTRLYATRS